MQPELAWLAATVLLWRVRVPVDSLSMPPPVGPQSKAQLLSAMLPDTVLASTVAMPLLSMPAPSPTQLPKQLDPGAVLVVLPETVLSVTVRVPPARFSMPPPAAPQAAEQPALALLSEMVESVTVRVPVASFSIPPPEAPQLPPQPALTLLLVTVASATVRVPSFSMPPPELPQGPPQVMSEAPSSTVIPEMVAVTPGSTWKTWAALLPLTASWAAPGPLMVRLVVMSMGPLVRRMGVAGGQETAKVMVSPGAAVATAWRRDPAPLSRQVVTVGPAGAGHRGGQDGQGAAGQGGGQGGHQQAGRPAPAAELFRTETSRDSTDRGTGAMNRPTVDLVTALSPRSSD